MTSGSKKPASLRYSDLQSRIQDLTQSRRNLAHEVGHAVESGSEAAERDMKNTLDKLESYNIRLLEENRLLKEQLKLRQENLRLHGVGLIGDIVHMLDEHHVKCRDKKVGYEVRRSLSNHSMPSIIVKSHTPSDYSSESEFSLSVQQEANGDISKLADDRKKAKLLNWLRHMDRCQNRHLHVMPRNPDHPLVTTMSAHMRKCLDEGRDLQDYKDLPARTGNSQRRNREKYRSMIPVPTRRTGSRLRPPFDLGRDIRGGLNREKRTLRHRDTKFQNSDSSRSSKELERSPVKTRKAVTPRRADYTEHDNDGYISSKWETSWYDASEGNSRRIKNPRRPASIHAFRDNEPGGVGVGKPYRELESNRVPISGNKPDKRQKIATDEILHYNPNRYDDRRSQSTERDREGQGGHHLGTPSPRVSSEELKNLYNRVRRIADENDLALKQSHDDGFNRTNISASVRPPNSRRETPELPKKDISPPARKSQEKVKAHEESSNRGSSRRSMEDSVSSMGYLKETGEDLEREKDITRASMKRRQQDKIRRIPSGNTMRAISPKRSDRSVGGVRSTAGSKRTSMKDLTTEQKASPRGSAQELTRKTGYKTSAERLKTYRNSVPTTERELLNVGFGRDLQPSNNHSKDISRKNTFIVADKETNKLELPRESNRKSLPLPSKNLSPKRSKERQNDRRYSENKFTSDSVTDSFALYTTPEKREILDCNGKRVLGEIAFQLDKRILSYVLNGKFNKEGKYRCFYGYSVGNLQQRIIEREKGDILEMMLDRYNYLMSTLNAVGYQVPLHCNVAIELVNKYGVMKHCGSEMRKVVIDVQDEHILRSLIRKYAEKSEIGNLLVLLQSLTVLSADDGMPLFVW